MEKKYLPIEPNLILLKEVFSFEYSSYKKILEKDFNISGNIKLFFTHYNIFETGDRIEFFYKNICLNKSSKISRYLFYSNSEYYFICRLNDDFTLDASFVSFNLDFRNKFFADKKGNEKKSIHKLWGKKLVTKKGYTVNNENKLF